MHVGSPDVRRGNDGPNYAFRGTRHQYSGRSIPQTLAEQCAPLASVITVYAVERARVQRDKLIEIRSVVLARPDLCCYNL